MTDILDNLEVFRTAVELVGPIVEKHGLEMTTSGTLGALYKTSAVEQHLNEIIRVADWLKGVTY